MRDEELLESWRSGDQEAGQELFGRHFESVFRFFRHRVDGPDAEELTQNTFLGCLEGRHRIAGSFRAYVYGVARNVFYGWCRSRAASVDFTQTSVADLGLSPTRLLARKAEHRLLLEALRSLPIDDQIVLELYYFEQLSGPDIAVVLGVPEGTFRGRLRRARQRLTNALETLAQSAALVRSTMSSLDDWAKDIAEEGPER